MKMTKIKVKEVAKGGIKTLNKAAHLSEKILDASVKRKDNSITDYGEEKIKNTTRKTTNEIKEIAIKKFKKKPDKYKIKTKEFKKKDVIKKAKKEIKKSERRIQNSKKVLNTAKRTYEAGKRLAIESAKKLIEGAKATVKFIASSIKALARIAEELIEFLVAGGWIVLVILLVILLVGMLFSSVFGIFFSSEKLDKNNVPMSEIVSELNNELASKITEIQNSNPHDDYIIESDRADWKDILSVYAVKLSNGKNETEVVTMNEEKKKLLKQVFWDMNVLTYEVKDEMTYEDMTDKTGPPKQVNKKVLHIKITPKTITDMQVQYNFSPLQIKQLNEISDKKFISLWTKAIYGSSTGDSDIVKIALSQIGNVGGDPYWSWYGFPSRVEWCACFVSWVANQAGYIKANIIPKFASCQNGADWFKAMGEWKDRGYIPKSGEIIFFDWNGDGWANHVGIVERTDSNYIYTIEGNSGDRCKQMKYHINSKDILGFGTPLYTN